MASFPQGPKGVAPKFASPMNTNMTAPAVPIVEKDAANFKQAEGLKTPATCPAYGPIKKSSKK